MAEAQRVLVIGGTRGTGRLIVELLYERGYRVRVLARDPERAATAVGAMAEVVAGDLTKPETLPPAVRQVDHVIVTAGVPSGRYAPEALVKRTDHDGMIDTIESARKEGFRGRFLYLNSIGIDTPSVSAFLINRLKRNTFGWRRRVEEALRASGMDYTIIRVGFLLDKPAGTRAIRVSQEPLPLAPWNRIARADVAAAFVAALDHPRASRATFEIVWRKGDPAASWPQRLDAVVPDARHAA